MIAGLPCDALHRTVTYTWQSLPSLIIAARSTAKRLHQAFRHLDCLELQEADVTPVLAEYLGALLKTQPKIKLLVAGYSFQADALLQADGRISLCPSGPLSLAQATLVAPLLRAAASLQEVQLGPGGRSLSIGCLRLRPDVRYNELVGSWSRSDAPASDAECALVAGLATGGSLRLVPSGLGTGGVTALRAAHRRCVLQVIDVTEEMLERRRQRGRREDFPWGFCAGLLALLVCFAMLRLGEEAHAREQGLPGALLPTHPVKRLTFHERLAFHSLPAPEAEVLDNRTEL